MIRPFLARWQEPIIWAPIAILILLVAFYLIPAIDPRAGIDGWGTIWGQLTVAAGILLAGFLTWLLRTTYQLELRDDDERELIDHGAGIDRQDGKRLGHGPASWQAVAILALDRAQWFALFWLLLSRLVP